VNPAGEKVEILSLGFSMPDMPPLKPPGVEAGMLLPLVVTWEAAQYGLHQIDVFLDERRLRSLGLSVRDASELEQDGGEQPEGGPG
jgi:hypothetical protein